MPKYNHAITIAFEVVSDHPQGEDITPQQLADACRARIDRIMAVDGGAEMIEACMPPYDTFEED
jgi:hypothetical protein